MLVSADWVVPVDASPIRGGAVLVRNGQIAGIGHAFEFENVSPRVPRFDLPGCALLPGLVNAHTHLSLTALEGLLPPTDFATWLGRVVPAIKALDVDDMAASAALGMIRNLSGGVTVVGDVAYGPEAAAVAADLGVAGVFFWEVLGVHAASLNRTLKDIEFPLGGDRGKRGRDRVGLTPHSPYTSGPQLLREVAALARSHDYPLAVHVAESPAETSLTKAGDGPLAGVARLLADGFVTPHASPVAYLDGLGVLDGAVAVHCVHLSPGDARVLARKARGVVLCPRSNAFLHNGCPPVDALLKAGATVAIGTDSSASNTSMDMFAEARALREIDPSLEPERLLRMMTVDGARALGLEAMFGSLVPGKQADLVALRVGETDDPVGEVVERGAPELVEAVVSAGAWRVRGGRPTMPEGSVERAAAVAASHVRAALEGMDRQQ